MAFPANRVCKDQFEQRVNAWRPFPAVCWQPGSRIFLPWIQLGYLQFPRRPGWRLTQSPSGQSMVTVLADEYMKIGNILGPGNSQMIYQPLRGDVIIWWKGFDPIHSAVIASPIIIANNGIDLSRTLIDSKNGTGRVNKNVPLTTIHNVYQTAHLVELYRRIR